MFNEEDRLYQQLIMRKKQKSRIIDNSKTSRRQVLKFLNSASLEDWESRNPTKGSNSVSASFYLDPAEIKAQCREAIDNLNEVSSKTINVEHKLDEFYQ